MQPSYAVTVQNAYGHNLRNVGKVISLDASRAVNTVGSGTIVLPDEYDFSYWQRDMRFKIYRRTGSGPRYLIGNTIWLANRFKKSVSGKFWEIGFKDAMDILNRNVVAYKTETVYADKTALNLADDPADNLMRQFVRENVGGFVTNQDRNLGNYFYVEENQDFASVVEKTASFEPLFSVLTDLANNAAELGTRLYFDMTLDEGERLFFHVFKNKLGLDRSNEIRFGAQFRNLADIELEWDYANEITVVYAKGMGQGAAQLVVEEMDLPRRQQSPFGRRETSIDFSNVDVESVLSSEAKTYLQKHAPRLTLTAKAVDTPTLQFGRNYFYGDLVKAVVDDLEFTCHIDAFNIRYEDGKEDLDVRLKGDVEI